MDNGANIQSQASQPKTSVAEKPRSAPPKKRRKAASLDKRKAKSGWLFVLPFILGLVLIYFPVVFNSFRYSISSMEFDRKVGYVFEIIGFDNYQEALFTFTLNGVTFIETLTTGITQLLIDIPAIVIFSLFIAVVLNQKILGRAAFRAIFFIPVICSTGIMSSIASATGSFNQNMSESIASGELDGGFSISAERIEMMFENMAIGSDIAGIVIGWVNTISSVIERSGVQMLIFLAALQSISPAIYESCSIDGATTWETFWKITLPMISPMILTNAIYTVIDSFTSASNGVMQFIDTVYNTPNKMVLSSAMAWMYFGIIILMVAVVFALLKTFTFYQKRD